MWYEGPIITLGMYPNVVLAIGWRAVYPREDISIYNQQILTVYLTYNYYYPKIIKHDELVKSQKHVTPAEVGVQNHIILLDSRFRGNDT